jgi:hypothetical protein
LKHKSLPSSFPSGTIVGAYTVVALVYCALSSWLYFTIAAQPVVAWIHVAAFLGVTAHYLLVKDGKNIDLGTHIILLVGTAVVGSQFLTGGWENSGLVWTFAYLPYAYFLGNKFTSRLWVGILIVLYLLLLIMHVAGVVALPYNTQTVIVFFGSLAVFVICMTAYQVSHYRFIGLVSSYQTQAEIQNKQLRSEVEERKKSEEELLRQTSALGLKTKQLEKLNNFMVGRELRMVQLKKQIEENHQEES